MWTPPLRELTPDTSYGFDVIRFAAHLGVQLYPWQEWLLIHGCELAADGRPRFRTVLVEVARQNGKTEVLVVLAAYWLFIERVRLVLGTSTTLDYARAPLDRMVAVIEASRYRRRVRPGWLRTNNNGVWADTKSGSRYRIAARNRRAGRSLSVDRLIADELREHADYAAWNASYNAMSARPDAQAWALSNAGTPDSVVLNDLRDAATDGTDSLLGYFGWTSPPGVDAEDVAALCQANPAAGRGGIRMDTLLTEAAAAVRAGGLKLAGFRTEKLCITVPTLDPAIDPRRWEDCAWDGDLSGARDRVALFVDVAPDGEHATLAAGAVLPDDRVAVEVVQAWGGPGAAHRAGVEIPALVRRVRPKALGWLPGGPAAELAAALARRRGWPPRGVELMEVRGDAAAACMALRSAVIARQIAHPSDPLIDAHIGAAERLAVGDRWVFGRSGKGRVDAAYAVAGVVQLARTLPTAPAFRPLVVVAG